MVIQDSGNASDVSDYDPFGTAQSLNADVMLLRRTEMTRRFAQEFLAFLFHCTKILLGSLVAYSPYYFPKELIIGSSIIAPNAILLFVAIWDWKTAWGFRCDRACDTINKHSLCMQMGQTNFVEGSGSGFSGRGYGLMRSSCQDCQVADLLQVSCLVNLWNAGTISR